MELAGCLLSSPIFPRILNQFSPCSSVPLCFKTHPSSTNKRVRYTQRHRDNRVVTTALNMAVGQSGLCGCV